MSSDFTPDMFIKQGERTDAPPYAPVAVHNGSRACEVCSKTISANKRKCYGCFSAEIEARERQGS